MTLRGVENRHPIPGTGQLLSHDLRDGPLRKQAGLGYPDQGGQCEAVEFFACGRRAPCFDGRVGGAGRRGRREGLHEVQDLPSDRRGAKNMVGPVLNGVVGRKAGSYPDYHYSDANKGSGITWDEANLKEYLRDPKAGSRNQDGFSGP